MPARISKNSIPLWSAWWGIVSQLRPAFTRSSTFTSICTWKPSIPESFYWRLNPGVMFARRRYREFKANLKSHDWLPRLAHLRFTK